ncbi:hypothetical protein [Anaerobacillus alkalilacustris]|nr:hypothetical protein [Anaerobacillus alkalilacustris]
MGVKIILDAEQSKRFLSCFIDDARRIIAERKRAERMAKEAEKQSKV